jgi:hypothetical protein
MQHAEGNLNPSLISASTSVNSHTSAFVLNDTPRDLGIELSPVTRTSEGTKPRVEGMTMSINCSGDQGFNEGMAMQMDGR